MLKSVKKVWKSPGASLLVTPGPVHPTAGDALAADVGLPAAGVLWRGSLAPRAAAEAQGAARAAAGASGSFLRTRVLFIRSLPAVLLAFHPFSTHTHTLRRSARFTSLPLTSLGDFALGNQIATITQSTHGCAEEPGHPVPWGGGGVVYVPPARRGAICCCSKNSASPACPGAFPSASSRAFSPPAFARLFAALQTQEGGTASAWRSAAQAGPGEPDLAGQRRGTLQTWACLGPS